MMRTEALAPSRAPSPLSRARSVSRLLCVLGCALTCALGGVLGGAATASAQAPLIGGLGGAAGFGPNTQCLGPNDDGSSSAIDITPYFPGGLRFFDSTHTRLYVNTNGNITFAGPVSTYTPNAFPVAAQPMIAPYWGDVDIRGPSCTFGSGSDPCEAPADNGVWWYFEPGRAIFTWDNVDYYRCKSDKKMSFQLILTSVPTCGGGAGGDFNVEFRFNRCEWHVGDASDGSSGNGDGLCQPSETGCVPAQSGFDAGDTVNYVAIMDSLTPNINTTLCTNSNVGEPGVWRFELRSGVILCPDAGDACTVPGAQGACAQGVTNCVGDTTECIQNVDPAPEVCDAIDNDCDGTVDEGTESELCGSPVVFCDRGVCIDACFEGTCPAGQVCTAASRCVDEGCETLECPDGQRCEAGACVGACDGITCPSGQGCRAGRCIDLCGSLTCDECTVCEGGACVLSCEHEGCAPSETCQADGHCVDTRCVGITCPTGQYCEAGSCVDACTGVVCPGMQVCMAGECQNPPPPPDAGPPVLPDAGPRPDSGTGGFDGGGVDAGRTGPPRGSDPGCGCRVPGAHTERGTGRGRSGAPLALGLLGLLGLVWARRRRSR